MKTIEAKDTVLVTKVFSCCAGIGALGTLYVVKKVTFGPFMCPICGKIKFEDVAVMTIGKEGHIGAPLYTLTNFGRAAWTE